MSLIVWCPLINDLHNQGISSTNLSGGGSFVSSGGKIGSGCFHLTTGGTWATIPELVDKQAFSICCWAKIVTSETFTNWADCWVVEANADGSLLPCRLERGRSSDSATLLLWLVARNDSSAPYKQISSTSSDSAWVHTVLTYDGTNFKSYANAVLCTTVAKSSFATSFKLSGRVRLGDSNSATYLNDFRIYDKALSETEIKELAKGLVAHYTLGNESVMGDNEVTWSANDGTVDGRTVYTDDRQSNKIYLYNKEDEYIVSADVKAVDPSSSSNSYPSIVPYDVDGYAINNEHTADGFMPATKTTITTELKSGDTVIYCQNLSNWSTTETYGYSAAIFGYKDSSNYIYPDLEYTRTIVTFGTTTDKSHINKTNNTITLNSAYSGRTIPVGTTIVLTKYGSTFYYPFGGFARSSVSSWTTKSVTIIPKNVNRLKYSRYILFRCYSGLYYSNIDIHNNTTRVFYDSSGYYRNLNLTLTTNLSIDTTTPRYKSAIKFNGLSGAIGPSPFGARAVDELTVSFWCKPNSSNGNYGSILANLNPLSGFWMAVKGESALWLYVSGFYVRANVTINVNTWYHVVLTYKNSTYLFYLNGEAVTTTTTNTLKSPTFTQNIVLGCPETTTNSGSSDHRLYDTLSDVRIYSTALSADDISDLYSLGAQIS